MAKPPSNRKKATSAASSNDTPPDNLIQEENPALATINVTAVEVSELTEREQSDRLLLERKVERAFFEAGKALAELRDRPDQKLSLTKFPTLTIFDSDPTCGTLLQIRSGTLFQIRS